MTAPADTVTIRLSVAVPLGCDAKVDDCDERHDFNDTQDWKER